MVLTSTADIVHLDTDEPLFWRFPGSTSSSQTIADIFALFLYESDQSNTSSLPVVPSFSIRLGGNLCVSARFSITLVSVPPFRLSFVGNAAILPSDFSHLFIGYHVKRSSSARIFRLDAHSQWWEQVWQRWFHGSFEGRNRRCKPFLKSYIDNIHTLGMLSTYFLQSFDSNRYSSSWIACMRSVRVRGGCFRRWISCVSS